MKNTLFIFIFLLTNSLLFAQHPVSIQLTQRDGLPDIEFYDMIEDDKGFMWFACNNGLYRYDGREFKSYSHPKKRGLSVFNLIFDDKKRLWCTNVTGQFFYVENDSLHLYFDASKEIKSEHLHAFNFFNGYLVAHYHNILFRKNILTNRLDILDIKGKNKPSFHYRNSVVKNDTIFFLKSIKGKAIVNYLSKNKDSLQNYVQFEDARFSQLYRHKNNLIYQQKQTRSTYRRVLVKKNKTINLKRILFKDFRLINNLFIEDNNLWYLTEKGVEVFSESEDFQIKKKHRYFSKKFITKVVKDKLNNYWFSTLRNGVFVVPNIHIKSYNLQDDIGNITTIEKVNDTHIYFGTTLGWMGAYDIKSKKISYIKFDGNVSRIRHILYNKKLNDVYIATNNSIDSYIVDVSTNKVNYPKKGVYFGGAKSMVLLKNGSLFSSLVQDHTLLTFSKGKIKTNKLVRLRNKRVYKTYYNANSETLYIANVDEFVMYDKNFKSTIIRYKGKPIFARGITQTSDGIIWISSFKDGVLAIKNNQVIKAYTTKNGLLSNQTNYIKADVNNIWVTTKKGLQLLNTKTDTFKTLTQQDGIESFNINGIEIIGNTVWYGSNLGLFSFDKTKVFKEREVLNPYFTSVTIVDSTHIVKPNYIIGYDDKRIQINFNTNGFQSAENTQYQYKLEGLQNKWQTISKGVNEVVFNSLEQGKYTFKLQTINGKKKSVVKEINFKVNGIFYKQWWFLALLLIGVISLIVYYYKSQLKKQEIKRNEEYEKQQNQIEKTALKLENLRSQMNPHFIFNALNSIQDYILHNEKKLARSFLVKFSRLIRMYLEHSQQSEITLEEELTALNLYLELEKDRFEDTFTYEVLVSDSINSETLKIPAFLVQPYVENAIKHGLLHKTNNRHLIVDFNLNTTKNILNLKIEDNGVGRQVANTINNRKPFKPASFSSKANNMRIKLINRIRVLPIKLKVKDKYDANNNPQGTIVMIVIPLDK